MRWDALFDDLEAQLAAAEQRGLEAELADRTRGETAGLTLEDRLRGQIGRPLRLRIAGAGALSGALSHVGAGWLSLRTGTRSELVALRHVLAFEGLDRFSRTEAARVRPGFASVLRTLAADRAAVQIVTADPGASFRVAGIIDRVGHDFLELAAGPAGETRTRANVTGVLTLPLQAVAVVGSLA